MRAHAWTCRVAESGTRRELPDDELSADRVRELLKLPNQTCSSEKVSTRCGRNPELLSVILSAAKDLMPVASGDEILRCAQDDKQRE
jgi:hypothetical protein